MTSADPMGRHQRFAAALQCLPVDRPPVTAWMHLGTEHLPPAHVAQLHEAYWRAYDWDVLKVMADYRVEIPLSIESFDTPQSLGCLQTAVQSARCFARQYECVARLMERVGHEVPVLNSGYDAYTLVLRHIGYNQVRGLGLGLNAEALQAVLEAFTQQICRHIERLKALGVAGYVHATWGAMCAHQPRGVSQETFECCVKPFDLRILQAAQGMVRVLHAHGSGLQLERLADYPLEVLHIADRTPGNPTLAQLRAWTPQCLMGGVDERTFTSFSVGGLRAQMGDAVAQAGMQGLILAPGCAVPPSSSGRLLKALRGGVGGAGA